ncbi:hypothetical protein ISN44_As12g034590 [Arabidopsis suecica]|uniref:DUF577 domain-containing protein n=1 Tax=Arabidopsis suecica TaxID=45249 RepID=A0A8T1YR06_ARASU|nr:hypothetical protein ISN44_As12g034590 [Arabidopsis suecica]
MERQVPPPKGVQEAAEPQRAQNEALDNIVELHQVQHEIVAPEICQNVVAERVVARDARFVTKRTTLTNLPEDPKFSRENFSGGIAMAESSNLQLIAREILVSESYEELAMIVDNLFKRQDSQQYKTSRALYDFCVSCNPAYNVVDLHKDKWDELGDCILSLVNSKEPVKAFHVFIDLPPVYKSFIDKFLHKIVEEASNVFLDPYRVEDWSLALQVFVKMWIQLVDTGMMLVLLEALMGIRVSSVVNSVKKLVKKEKEDFLVQGLEDFERFFSREMNLYKYTKDQCHFVLDLMIKIKGFGTHLTKDIVRKIIMLVTEPDNHAIKPQDDDLQNRREEFERGWYDHLKSLSSLEVLKIFASTDLEDRSREMAIRRLNCLLSDNTTEKVEIDIAEMRELQPLIISCLKEEGISFSMFKVLGEVVNHVAYEILVCQEETWYDLRDYIASSTTEFQRAVYIFQCLLMKFDDKKFLYPVMDNLYQEIIERLAPPGEVLVDNSCWVFAFTGAFCAAIHLIEDPGYANAVSEIAYKMIDSVKEIVERGMEVGLVRRAFRDVEIIVKEQLEWYSTSEYKFVKGLLWKLYAIKGMKWQSKIVLWRINVIIDRDVEEEEKERPQNDLHWLNLPAANIQLIDDDFLNPVMENLCPVISTRLDPPTELLVDNSCWVLAFTSAFCAVIHMIEDPGYAESPKEIAYKMIESVRKLVEREMEVGLVRRAFRDVETIVKKQLEWYGKFEYKFVKGLLWRLYAVKGMKWESKIVLWRINVIVERGVKKVEKELPKEDEFDWLNLRDDDDDDDDDDDNDDDEIYQELALDDAAVTEALELHKIRAVNGQFSKLVL